MTAAVDIGLSRSERLDRLPFTREHRRLVVVSGIGWALDAMDVGLISFVMAALAVQWGLGATTLSWVASIGFVGMAIGAGLGGLLADRIGRRQVFAVTLLLYGLATGAAALAWSVAALVVFRFVIGLGLGAELPVAATLVSEFAPARIRGRVVVVLEAFWAIGWLLAALIGYFVIPLSDDGWRWALALGAVPALYAAAVRFGLPESVRFLERRGRVAEAEAAVRRFEGSAGVRPPAAPLPAGEPEPVPGPATLWQAGIRLRTAALWLVWFGVNFSYYGGVHLAAHAARRVRAGPSPVVRVHSRDHACPAARLRARRRARRGMGPPAHPIGVPARVGRLGSGVRHRHYHRGHGGRRHGAVVLQPRRMGRVVRDHARGLSDPAPRDRLRVGRRVRPDRFHPRSAGGAGVARERRQRLGVRGIRGVLRARRGGHLGAARAPR
jgi:MFS family permease